jgi:hypothetical protein
MCSIITPPPKLPFMISGKVYDTARQATDGNIIRGRPDPICMLGNKGKNTDALRIFNTNRCFMETTVMRTHLCCVITYTACFVKLSYDKVTIYLWN